MDVSSWSKGMNHTVSVDEPGIDLPHLTLQTVIGITVAVAGNVVISLALNLQKLAHLRLAKERKQARMERELHVSGDALRSRLPHDQRPSDDPATCSHESETQPLIQGSSTSRSRACYGTSASTGTRRDDSRSRKSTSSMRGRRPGQPQRKPSFASRFLPLRLNLHGGVNDEYGNVSHTQETLAIPVVPVDVIPAERIVAFNGNHRPEFPSPEIWEEEGRESDYLRSKIWWSGFVLMNIGETGNFISYAFAPASVVAPLGTVGAFYQLFLFLLISTPQFALIANCFFAPLILKERFRVHDLAGILLAIVGAITVVLSTPSSDDGPPPLTPDALIIAISQRSFVIFTIIYLVGAVILAGLSEGSLGRRVAVVDIGLCAIFGGFTVLATKAISTLLTEEWAEIFTEWITYPVLRVICTDPPLQILIITGILQIRFLNRALKRFDSKIVIPTQFVLFTLSAVIGSAVLYKDFQRATFHQMVTFTYGCGATFAGVFIIAWANGNNGDVGQATNDNSRQTGGTGEINAPSENVQRVPVGSLNARSRPALVIPRAVRETPVLRHKQSTVSLAGYSPARNLLLVHTPPRDRADYWDRDVEGGSIAGSSR
ncbi:magnesium transporter NIPA-domain-containing protein [Suillus paluster]|uniref:magnesium transporter NIPA-domain-containing protein n=1 Tax=Suillus paluster TaxID=48578 RepID=UPI001B87B562|nr:magnesium transporter NIPA-domain-containing protein [Suillus paluster]KAG1753876.1 magnesium transporter NIPA-domain-containing protein [Suillus paluster]